MFEYGCPFRLVSVVQYIDTGTGYGYGKRKLRFRFGLRKKKKGLRVMGTVNYLVLVLGTDTRWFSMVLPGCVFTVLGSVLPTSVEL